MESLRRRRRSPEPVTPVWVRATRETLWHLAESSASALILPVLCGHFVWPPIHRLIEPIPPVDELCAACRVGIDAHRIRWPQDDFDTMSTVRCQSLSAALDELEKLHHGGHGRWPQHGCDTGKKELAYPGTHRRASTAYVSGS